MIFRKKRKKRSASRLLSRRIHPQILFLTGAICVVLFLLQGNLLLRSVQVALFGFLATMNGKRILWGYFMLMVGSITVFHLFQPAGEVLFRIAWVPITAGAVRNGVFKGLTIIGLVFISLFSIRPNLRIPGNIGSLLTGTLMYFERILEHRGGLRLHGLLSSVDSVLEDVFPVRELSEETSRTVSASQADTGATSKAGLIFCIVVVTLNAGFIPMGTFLR
ncbi:MAG: hypothetical protein ACOC0D_04740 [Spirochaeta sp.]